MPKLKSLANVLDAKEPRLKEKRRTLGMSRFRNLRLYGKKKTGEVERQGSVLCGFGRWRESKEREPESCNAGKVQIFSVMIVIVSVSECR